MLTKKKLLVLLVALLMVFSELPFVARSASAAGTSVKEAAITISPLTYNGQIQKPTVKLTIGQVVLVEGTDYDLEFANPSSINAGRYKLTITGKGNFSGKVNEQYVIDPKKITPTVKLTKDEFVFNGAAQKAAVSAVMDGSVKLTADDYSVVYPAESKNVGSYNVAVTLKGNYSGSKTVKYKINPKGTSLKTLTKGSRYIKVTWAKQTTPMAVSKISGYQIMLASNSKFTKGKKTVTVKGCSTGSKKVTKLKGGTKYYVKIRTYMTVSGTKYYSKWSKTKTVTTKP